MATHGLDTACWPCRVAYWPMETNQGIKAMRALALHLFGPWIASVTIALPPPVEWHSDVADWLADRQGRTRQRSSATCWWTL